MTTLQTGTKVLIEATVEFHDTRIDKYAVKTKNGDHVYFVPSDLTVCETAEPIDLNNFAINITDPVNAELLPGFKEWLRKTYWDQTYIYQGKYNGNWIGYISKPDKLTTLPDLQKQHPGVFEKEQKEVKCLDCGKVLQGEIAFVEYCSKCWENQWLSNPSEQLDTPSFKAGQEYKWGKEYEFSADGVNWEKGLFISKNPRYNDDYLYMSLITDFILGSKYIRPIPAQPTVESELLEIVEGVESCRYSTKLAVEKILAWHQKYTRLSSELRNLLEDVVNELELSDVMIEKHGPLGTEPSKLVRLVLDQKDQQIKALKAGMIDIKHSGRVEVSVPSDEEIMKERVHRNYQTLQFDIGAMWMRDNFMTRKEAK